MQSIQIRVAVLQICNDSTCSVTPDLARHLRVEYYDKSLENLENTSSLAASYTWGEFSREKKVIGHDSKGEISMELGSEWNLQDLIDTLAKVDNGNKHAGIWIDQLCIDQMDEKAKRDTLTSIPTIYRALEVVVVMPGGNCSCLRDSYERISNMPDNKESEIEIMDLFESKIGYRSTCLNYLGINSYFDRVWTRQELLYARSIRIIRTNPSGDLPCVRDEIDVDNLSHFSRLLYSRNLNNSRLAYGILIQENFAFWHNVEDAADGLEMEHKGNPTFSSGLAMFTHKMLILHAFLLGEKLVRPQILGEGNDAKKLIHFLKHLQDLAVSTRKATKPKDYVLSVWVDCPGYVLPMNFAEMNLPHLLEDAIKQLEQKYTMAIQVSRLPGLFGGNSDESVLWRPTVYLTPNPASAAEIYSPILQPDPLLLLYRRGVLPLELPLPLQMPLSSRARYYSEHFYSRSVEYVMNAMRPIIRNWASGAGSRVTYFYGFQNPVRLGNGMTDSFVFKANLMLLSSPEKTDYEDIFSHYSIPRDFDHQQAVYEMVAVALGLAAEDCERHKLRLMIVPDVAIGFTVGDVGKGSQLPQDITVSMAAPSDTGALLEASYTAAFTTTQSETKIPRYRVMGIWVPIRNQDKLKYTAYTHVGTKEFQAVLG